MGLGSIRLYDVHTYPGLYWGFQATVGHDTPSAYQLYNPLADTQGLTSINQAHSNICHASTLELFRAVRHLIKALTVCGIRVCLNLVEVQVTATGRPVGIRHGCDLALFTST